LYAVTDANGYFEITGVPANASGYTLKISRATYLDRVIANVVVTGDTSVSRLFLSEVPLRQALKNPPKVWMEQF